MILQDCDLVQTIPGAAADWNVVHKRTVHILKPDSKGGRLPAPRISASVSILPRSWHQSLMFGGSWIFWCKNLVKHVKHSQTW